MFAVLKIGGKQYRVSEGDSIRVEKLPFDKGDKVALEQVLMLGDESGVSIGAPVVSNASVDATVTDQSKTRTLLVFKKRRRKHFRRKNGHRQHFMVLHIDRIKKGKE
ncbi:MAG: 50S ribosomal protein L21 [Holosporales bacterium]|jgi:large subunit ribosomal protein L21|nr:50S ribosomal protein L21 [Holosporales bacterium]